MESERGGVNYVRARERERKKEIKGRSGGRRQQLARGTKSTPARVNAERNKGTERIGPTNKLRPLLEWVLQLRYYYYYYCLQP
jgi:hypothetical protein